MLLDRVNLKVTLQKDFTVKCVKVKNIKVKDKFTCLKIRFNNIRYFGDVLHIFF